MNKQTFIGSILTVILYTLFFACLLLWSTGIAGLLVFVAAGAGFFGGTICLIYYFTGDTAE